MNWYKIAQHGEYDYGNASQEELQEEARMWEDAMQEVKVPSKAFHWTYYPEFPLERFLSVMSSDEWVQAFNNEQEWAAEDGREGYYDDMILKPIEEPIIAVDIGSDIKTWDGYHRVCASFAKGAKTIRAIIGKKI
jgi:hypothetical protein